MSQRIERQTKSQDSKALTCHWDTFGRNVGYSVDGDRKQSITYDSPTGRIAESDGFRWDYLAGSNLKSKLTYPNEAVVTWSYEPHRDLLTAVTNATYSTYIYTNDLLGRRTSKNDEQYGYNVRNELIAADEVSYNYDDIGNRTTAEGKTYTANNLNQYTAIDDFTPQHDADGNQTVIKTPTGIWSVVYNAENRPVSWTRGDTVITMVFDRLGRRVDYQEMRDDQVATHFRFVYDNFLCVQRLNTANGNAVRTEFVWDPTEPIATRPLVMRAKNWDLNLFYTHDGNKNVSEVFYHALQNGIAAHYDYAPFGAVSRTSRATRVTNRDVLSENPFRFSSEYHDATLGLVYYNYRHYNPKDGRWLGRDCSEKYGVNLYVYIGNTISQNDILGLIERTYVQRVRENIANCSEICPKMANWEAGLAYLDSLLLSDGGKNYLDSVGESLNLVLDVISTGETAKDVWNVLTETMSEELRIGITFEEIKKPLSKVRDRIAFMNIVQKLKTVDMLSSAEQIRLLGDILDVSRMPEIPILDEYFGGTFGVVEEALENIETVYTDYRYRDLSVFEDCAALKNYLYGSGRLGSTEILSRLLKKTP